MTLQELYANIGGEYEMAQRIMRKDALIDRYIRRLPANGECALLLSAGQTMDPQGLFEHAHALKGVAANLGLTELARLAGEITEEFRPGAARRFTDGEVREKLAALDALYRNILRGIEQYMAG